MREALDGAKMVKEDVNVLQPKEDARVSRQIEGALGESKAKTEAPENKVDGPADEKKQEKTQVLEDKTRKPPTGNLDPDKP